MTTDELKLYLAAELASKIEAPWMSAADVIRALQHTNPLVSLLAEEVCKLRGIQVVRG